MVRNCREVLKRSKKEEVRRVSGTLLLFWGVAMKSSQSVLFVVTGDVYYNSHYDWNTGSVRYYSLNFSR